MAALASQLAMSLPMHLMTMVAGFSLIRHEFIVGK